MCSLMSHPLQAAPKNCRRRKKTNKTYLLIGVLVGNAALAARRSCHLALAQRATLATRNLRHFADLNVAVVNPWNQ